MPGPWEKYQAQPQGPWTKYQAVDPEEQKRVDLDAQIRREMEMSPDEWEKTINEQMDQGLPYRDQPGRWRMLGDQLTDLLGIRDEFAGAGSYTRALVGSGFDFDKAADAYSKTADVIRAEQRVARDENTIIPEILGGFGTTAVGKGFKLAPTLFGRIGQSAKAGAGFAAAAGVGNAEDGIINRAIGGGTGAAMGAVLGPLATEVAAPAIGAVVRGSKSAGRSLADAVATVRGKEANKLARLNKALEQQNMTPSILSRRLNEAQDAAKFGQTQLDPKFTIADTGPVTADLADTAALVSPEARKLSGEFLSNRSRDQFNRANDYFRRSLKVTRDNYAKTQNRLVDEQRVLSGDAYRQAYSDKRDFDFGQVLFDAQFDEMATAGPLQRALKRARNLFIDPSRAPGKQASLNTQRFDSGKRALDDMIQTARNAGRNNEARMLTDLKHKLLSVIDSPKGGNTAYKAARDVYSSRAELLDSLAEGRKFMRGDAEMTGAQYKTLSTAEKKMFRVGMAREMRKALGGKQLGQDMIGIFDKPNTQEILKEIMSPAQFRKFYQLMDVEEAMAATSRAVRGNSKTAQRQQDVLDFSFGVRLGRAIKDKGLLDALKSEIADQITKAMAMRNADAVAVTQALFETDPAAQRAIAQQLAQRYGGRNSRPLVKRAERIARLALERHRRALVAPVTEQANELME